MPTEQERHLSSEIWRDRFKKKPNVLSLCFPSSPQSGSITLFQVKDVTETSDISKWLIDVSRHYEYHPITLTLNELTQRRNFLDDLVQSFAKEDQHFFNDFLEETRNNVLPPNITIKQEVKGGAICGGEAIANMRVILDPLPETERAMSVSVNRFITGLQLFFSKTSNKGISLIVDITTRGKMEEGIQKWISTTIQQIAGIGTVKVSIIDNYFPDNQSTLVTYLREFSDKVSLDNLTYHDIYNDLCIELDSPEHARLCARALAVGADHDEDTPYLKYSLYKNYTLKILKVDGFKK